MRKCKGCGKEYERLSMSGFCEAALCQFREEGYVLAQKQQLNPLAKPEVEYFRQMGIKVDD